MAILTNSATGNEVCQMFNGCAVMGECPLERAVKMEGKGTPYQIHITVSPPNPIDAYETYFAEFDAICKLLGIRAILLDNELRDGSLSRDMMTTSTHRGDDESAKCEMDRLVRMIGYWGYDILRSKIETVPWHAKANAPDDSQYQEAHVTIICRETDIERLAEVARDAGAHMSKNALKRAEQGMVTVMATLRAHCDAETFAKRKQDLLDVLEFNAFTPSKVIAEFTLFDSNEAHDNAWMKDMVEKLELDHPETMDRIRDILKEPELH